LDGGNLTVSSNWWLMHLEVLLHLLLLFRPHFSSDIIQANLTSKIERLLKWEILSHRNDKRFEKTYEFIEKYIDPENIEFMHHGIKINA
jgi:hypothetical protein